MLTALRFWKTAIAGRKIVLHTDNTAVFHGLQKSSMRGNMMTPLREVKLLCAQLDIELILRWVPTKENLISDLLSRRDLENWTAVGSTNPENRRQATTHTAAAGIPQLPGLFEHTVELAAVRRLVVRSCPTPT